MPSTVDTGFAQWLRDPALFASNVNASLSADILAAGVDTEVLSPLSASADAEAEAARQMAVLGGPLAIDQHTVKGKRLDLIGKVVTLTNDVLGYSAGVVAFVIDADEQANGSTVLQVVRTLAPPPWSPIDLFASGEEGGVYIPALSPLWTTSGGATPSAVGDPVGQADNLVSGKPHLLQGTAGNRPLLQQTAGGKNYLDFDGSNDGLFATFTPWSDALCWVLAMRITGANLTVSQVTPPGPNANGAGLSFGAVYVMNGAGNSDSETWATSGVDVVLGVNGDTAAGLAVASVDGVQTALSIPAGLGGLLNGLALGSHYGSGGNAAGCRVYGAMVLGREATGDEFDAALAYFGDLF